MNIGNFLDVSEFRYPDKTAVVFKNRRYTFSQVKDRVQRLMKGLAGLGVKKGDRVAALMWNSAEMMEINLAAMRLGAVFAPMNFRFKAQELAYVVENARPSVLVTDDVCREPAAEVLPPLLEAGCLFSTSPRAGAEFRPYESLIEENTAFDGSVSVTGDDPCQLLYTSGTTARPKGVILSHDNVMWNAFNMIHARGDSSDDVSLVVGPLFHAAALNSHYVPRLALGATLIIMDKFESDVMMSLIQTERATIVPGNPTLFIMLLEHCAGRRYDTSTVTKLTSGSDKLPDHIKKELMRLFPNAEGVYDIYGLTEGGPCLTLLDARDSLRKTACVGLPLPFVQIRLLDDNGRPVSTGEPGEIVAKGPNVMTGYYGMPEATAEAIRDDWLYTGDLARADEEGFLYIVDRKKDMIVTGGENVAAREVEEVLFTHPDILKAAVLGMPDPKWGERVTAAVVLRRGRDASADEIREFLKERLAGYKVPKEIVFVTEFPESGAGKVQKNVLKKRLGG
ncbi:MAG: long-chain fatty acid--CoA ligase [Deltaproteobacteria bacterium]|nr:long-chain fatty acid--CoA ligase [Deltaproteobacteria bacterium]MBW1817463.1 long-chain fatty acid--CoA ligase [Deltaproteobacteria bacterium]MBW2284586.1 long-chain fatty acid--CoA ligase [Deltaproteobacteria bacterium]